MTGRVNHQEVTGARQGVDDHLTGRRIRGDSPAEQPETVNACLIFIAAIPNIVVRTGSQAIRPRRRPSSANSGINI
jgi:hypothetical protein